jgi:hypothetical protein
MRVEGVRELGDLDGIGPAMLADFEQLGVRSVGDLARRDARDLYDRLCRITRSRQDPCVLDVFACAIAQARDPKLPAARRQWWWWSRRRKRGADPFGDAGRRGAAVRTRK